ncbi:MAG: hypothetical protein ACKOXK_00700 [Chakrabartia sp.]
MIFTPLRFAPASLLALLAGCAAPGTFPSLNPRPIEAKAADLLAPKDVPAAAPRPSDPAVARQIDSAVTAARATMDAFEASASRATSAVAAAGPAESESWIAAQMAVSEAEHQRGPVKAALAELDSLLQPQIAAGPGDDLDHARQAIRDVEALDAQQSARIAALLAGLSR